MDKDRIREEIGTLLGNTKRDFNVEPLTEHEASELILRLHDILGNYDTDESLVDLYFTCLIVAKECIWFH